MKNNTILTLTSLLILAGSLTSVPSTAATKKAKPQASQSDQIDASKDIDSLGGNDDLMKMANNIDPENKSRIVQKRSVDRHNRLELGMSYGQVLGGDSYMQTQNFGGSIDFHFNPHWSLGVRYYDYGNSLTSEGQRAFDDARAAYNAGGRSYSIPDIDYPLRSAMAVVDWYPIYGKTNILDVGIIQFDMYLLTGAGEIELSSGWTPVYTAGGGLAMWISKRITARAEVRYQNYHDQIITGSRNINEAVATIGLGFLL